jgi:hypothetical protein
VLFFTVLASAEPGSWLSALIFSMLAVFVMIRFGLLALVANDVVFTILQHSPLTTQFSAWYAGIGLTGILRAGRRVLKQCLTPPTLLEMGIYRQLGTPTSTVAGPLGLYSSNSESNRR